MGRILNHKGGIPILQSYLVTDAFIAAEAIMQGSNVVHTALIVTASPEEIKSRIFHGLDRGITEISGKGGYTGTTRLILYCVISRSDVSQLKLFRE